MEVYAVADALVEPGLRDQGFLDTAVVTIRYSNGAIAVAEANFSALYGYDIRGEVFGSRGMVQAGRATETAARRYTAEGMSADTPRLNVELFRQAYTDELVDFADAVRAQRDGRRDGTEPAPKPFSLTPGAHDARRALAMALACIESVKQGTPVAVNEKAVL